MMRWWYGTQGLVILGHHYQRDEVIQFADFRGDSFLLSQNAAAQREAEFILFCGVHFMAETADILTGPHQQVILPNITAGCSMADMAPTDDVLDAWDDLKDVVGGVVIPITYMNSTAAIKAMCGRNGGIVCTSVPIPKAEPGGASFTTLMMNSVEPSMSAASTTSRVHSGYTTIFTSGCFRRASSI